METLPQETMIPWAFIAVYHPYLIPSFHTFPALLFCCTLPSSYLFCSTLTRYVLTQHPQLTSEVAYHHQMTQTPHSGRLFCSFSFKQNFSVVLWHSFLFKEEHHLTLGRGNRFATFLERGYEVYGEWETNQERWGWGWPEVFQSSGVLLNVKFEVRSS
jgi:hypothetical protein